MKTKTIHFFQHVPFEEPGYVADWAIANDYEISYTRFYDAEYHLPDPVAADLLVVLGGPMSVHDEHLYAWLQQEKAFIKDRILAGKKVLGICLGAQLAANCLGATVVKAINKEIGWYPVQTTAACASIPWFYDLFADNPVVFHWHGEKFEIPYNGSIELLNSEANNNQAFLFNGQVLGLQFHLEVKESNVSSMLTHCAADLIKADYVQNETTIKDGLVHITAVNRLMHRLLDKFVSL